MSLEVVAPHFLVALYACYCFVSVFFHDAALVRSGPLFQVDFFLDKCLFFGSPASSLGLILSLTALCAILST